MNKFFILLKKIIFSAILIYSFDVLGVSINISIPINFITIMLVSLFDFPALICLVFFKMSFL